MTLATLSIVSLAACGKEKTRSQLLDEFVGSKKIANYTVDSEMNIESSMYGEDIKMNWKASDVIKRDLTSGDLQTSRKLYYNTLVDTEDISMTNYAIGNKYYMTYDGQSFFETGYSPKKKVTTGPLEIASRIVKAADNGEDIKIGELDGEINGHEAEVLSGKLSGDYLYYLIDEVNMVGLTDFKDHLDAKVSLNTRVYLDKKDKTPLGMEVNIGNASDTIKSLVTDNDTSDFILKNFYLKYTFNDFGDGEITLPEAANKAKHVDKIDENTIKKSGIRLEEKENMLTISSGDFSTKIPDSWKKQSSVDQEQSYKGLDAHGKAYSTLVFKYVNSESTITLKNPVIIENLAMILGMNTENLDYEALKDTIVSKYTSNGYEALRNRNSNPENITFTKTNSNRKYYVFFVFGDNQFIEIDAEMDGSEIYKDYYDKVIVDMIDSINYTYHEDKVEETEPETEQETETTDNSEELIKGTVKNPYNSSESVEIRGIDLVSMNIVTEQAKLQNVLTDKILVGQKLKDLGIKEDGNSVLVFLNVQAGKIKYSDNSSSSLEMSLSLCDETGEEIGDLINSGKPLEKEYSDGISFTQDNESKDLTFGFKTKDDFDINKAILKISYNDPDFGSKTEFIKLK